MLALILPLLALVPATAQGVPTTFVTDPLSGLALSGYDAVSYFAEPQPVLGRGDFEFRWGGVIWQFATAANRDIFQRSPGIYAPQYGGYDGMGAARGFLARGRPQLYTIFKQRLYLFYSTSNRQAFLLAPDQAAAQGLANWPGLSARLVRN